MSADAVRRRFRNPGREWRGAPFWSWNDELEPEEIRRQIREMKEAGLGGFFMHSRTGLVTAYMGGRWMGCIGAAVDEARRLGMQAWLYDEDRWPSGFGGGSVAKRDPEFAMKYLELVGNGGTGEQRFAVLREGGRVRSYRRLAQEEEPGPTEEVQEFRVGAAPRSMWFNGGPYVDNMNPRCVKAFLEICYERYRRRFAHEFGKTIPGIFTDEPNIFSLHGVLSGRRVPWTGRLPAEFRRRRGYDVLERLPELFLGDPQFFKTRHDFWWTVTELFSEAYCKQLGEWCERNRLELTGHMLCEQEFEDEIPVGGAAMPSLAHMQRPGIDILTEQTRETLTCKQASSIAHQMGRRRTLSETYGTSGWHMTFEAQKWSGDWQTALGINTRCQHLTPYSIRGMRKRDYPPAFFYQQPWWKYFHLVEDYFARACLFTGLGQPVREVLLLHNISTGWGEAPEAGLRKRHGDHLNQVAEDLLALHYDFDLGDEIVLSREGSVKRRRVVVGRASYRLVIVPECDTIFRSTGELLKGFLETGGKVIAMGRHPTRLEGEPAPELEGLFANENVTRIAAKRDELRDALDAVLPRRVSVVAEAGREVGSVIYQERRYRGRSYVMLASRDRDAGHRLTVSLPGEGAVEQWDLETGKIRSLPARRGSGKTMVEINLAPTGSAALVLDPSKRPATRRRGRPEEGRVLALSDRWEVGRSIENSLVLDRCQWRFAGEEWSEPMPAFAAQREIREKMGLMDISHSNIPQPWVRYAEASTAAPRAVELRFEFEVAEKPRGGIDLVLESAELFEILVNGRPIDNHKKGWWLDRSMDRVGLAHVKRGGNELVLCCEYRDAPEYELEECYLIGEFGVDRATDAIGAEPQTLRPGDWCDQGYPYYAGNLFYRQEVKLRLRPREKAVVKVGPHFGACVAVHVNGRLAGVRGWAPYEVDVTEHVNSGRNRIEIEICGSPRNLLGPNHLPEKRPAWTGPGEFIRLDEWVDRRNLIPYGLFGEVTLEILR